MIRNAHNDAGGGFVDDGGDVLILHVDIVNT